jgi:hypothetical protein
MKGERGMAARVVEEEPGVWAVKDAYGPYEFFKGRPLPLPLAETRDGIAIIPIGTARRFVERYHYLGRSLHMGQLSYGLFREGRLDGVFTFGYPFLTVHLFGFHPLDYLDFARCIWFDKTDRNTGSRALATILPRLADDWVERYPERSKPLLVLSYADLSRHTGTLYRACNFIGTGIVKGHHGYGRGYKKAHDDGLALKRRFVYPLTRKVRRALLKALKQAGVRDE